MSVTLEKNGVSTNENDTCPFYDWSILSICSAKSQVKEMECGSCVCIQIIVSILWWQIRRQFNSLTSLVDHLKIFLSNQKDNYLASGLRLALLIIIIIIIIIIVFLLLRFFNFKGTYICCIQVIQCINFFYFGPVLAQSCCKSSKWINTGSGPLCKRHWGGSMLPNRGKYLSTSGRVHNCFSYVLFSGLILL